MHPTPSCFCFLPLFFLGSLSLSLWGVLCSTVKRNTVIFSVGSNPVLRFPYSLPCFPGSLCSYSITWPRTHLLCCTSRSPLLRFLRFCLFVFPVASVIWLPTLLPVLRGVISPSPTSFLGLWLLSGALPLLFWLLSPALLPRCLSFCFFSTPSLLLSSCVILFPSCLSCSFLFSRAFRWGSPPRPFSAYPLCLTFALFPSCVTSVCFLVSLCVSPCCSFRFVSRPCCHPCFVVFTTLSSVVSFTFPACLCTFRWTLLAAFSTSPRGRRVGGE